MYPWEMLKLLEPTKILILYMIRMMTRNSSSMFEVFAYLEGS